MNFAPWHPFRNFPGRARSLRAWLVGGALVATTVAAASVATLASASPTSTGPASAFSALAPASQTPAQRCAALADLKLPETIKITAELDSDGTFPLPPQPPFPPPPPLTGLPEFCRVAITVEQQINIEVWLPTDTYNRRFQAVGGGVYAGSISYSALAGALSAGYATASTDTGHQAFFLSGSWALNADGTLNWPLIEDFASRSLFELTKKAKAVIKEFYGRDAKYSYWNGCSTGGRQGMMLAQRFPSGYDGILAGAPAIHWDRFHPAQLWPQVVMQQELGGPIAQCKLAVATQAALSSCDGIDGVTDGVIEDPRTCHFDPRTLVGTSTACGTFTEDDARVLQMIWDGPRGAGPGVGSFLWYGLEPGAPLFAMAGPNPFPVTLEHLRFWVKQDPTFDWHTLGYEGLEEFFKVSRQKFGHVIGTDDPNLNAFRKAGGKVLMWHGWNDQLIFPEGSIDYYDRVIRGFGSTKQAQKFARLFMAPGVEHCGGGVGPNVFDMFGALVDWVEKGNAPDRITASRIEGGNVVRTRPLCPYPSVATYDGKGDPSSADSFKCKEG